MSLSDQVLLTDTNAAYKLYFFRRKGLIAEAKIQIPNLGLVEFHPIVLDEVEGHIHFFQNAVAFGISDPTENAPPFFKELLEEDFPKINKFVKDNLCNTVEKVEYASNEFSQKRKLYDAERVKLQKKWEAAGVKGKKVTSKPSNNDYAILLSAEKSKLRIVTHDEILSAVATEFLDDEKILKVEDLIYQIYENDNSLKNDIERVLDNLVYLGEDIKKHRVFRS